MNLHCPSQEEVKVQRTSTLQTCTNTDQLIMVQMLVCDPSLMCELTGQVCLLLRHSEACEVHMPYYAVIEGIPALLAHISHTWHTWQVSIQGWQMGCM